MSTNYVELGSDDEYEESVAESLSSSSQASFEESTLVVFQMQLSKNKKTVPDSRNYMLT